MNASNSLRKSGHSNWLNSFNAIHAHWTCGLSCYIHKDYLVTWALSSWYCLCLSLSTVSCSCSSNRSEELRRLCIGTATAPCDCDQGANCKVREHHQLLPPNHFQRVRSFDVMYACRCHRFDLWPWFLKFFDWSLLSQWVYNFSSKLTITVQ